MGLKFEHAPDSPGRLVKTPMAGLHLQFDSVSLGWGLRNCISNKFPVMLMLLFQEPHFQNHCSRFINSQGMQGTEHAKVCHENAISKIKTRKLLNCDLQEIHCKNKNQKNSKYIARKKTWRTL